MTRIPITRPLLGPEERAAVLEPLETGWVVQGPFVERFERGMAEFVGVPHACAATSCTTAMHLAVCALGLSPGDEVIVPGFTWLSTANVVEYMGGKPVFCDIDLRTFNLDVACLEVLWSERTVGVIPVHLFGLCAAMDEVRAFAARHGVWVLEDAACGFGARIGEHHAGSMGDVGCFSFHPRKAITTGEGGMTVTARKDLDEMMRSLRDHGASRSDRDRHTGKAGFLLPSYDHLGFNYRLTDIQGALGCAQLRRADQILGGRALRATRYTSELEHCDWLVPPHTPVGFTHGYQAYVCLFRPEAPTMANVSRLHTLRNELMSGLERRGIATRPGTHAPVNSGYYSRKYGLRPEDYPNATMAEALTLALPLYPQMTDAEQSETLDALLQLGPTG